MALFIPITKVDAVQRLVYGTLSEEAPDKAGEILDYESSKPAFITWSDGSKAASGGKSLGNVRAMHGSVAAGKFTDILFDDDNKRIEGIAKIVDEDEWQKVLEGVYTGFSIGGGYAKRWRDESNPSLMRYTPVLSEVSLVDNPAVPSATFQMIKKDGSVELHKFNFSKEASVNDTMVKFSVDDDVRISQLLAELSWLADLAAEEEDEELLACTEALEACLQDDSEPEEEESSAQKYARELAEEGGLAKFERHDHALQKRLGEMDASLQKMQKRIHELESMPQPGKGSLRAIGKQEDNNDQGEMASDLTKLAPAERTRALMKAALASPVYI